MMREISLLSPIFVSLFWTIILFSSDDEQKNQQKALGMFMFLVCVVFVCQFIYFRPYPDLYPYFNFPLRLAILMAYPVFHIYFRIITVESMFSLRNHWTYLSISTIVIIVYGIAIALTPKIEFRAWLYNANAYPESVNIQFLSIASRMVQVTFLLQIIGTIIGNFVLIKKHREKAEQFYSNILVEKMDKTLALSITIALMSVTAFTLVALGQHFLLFKNLMICIGWLIIAITLFIIGYMGSKQRATNMIFCLENELDTVNNEEKVFSGGMKSILDSLIHEFEVNRIHLNSQLNIMDVAKLVGSNRTYISNLINQQFDQNFCAFVNNYRLIELEKAIQFDPSKSIDTLIEQCGFGSINSMKRAIQTKSGMSFNKWKDSFCEL